MGAYVLSLVTFQEGAKARKMPVFGVKGPLAHYQLCDQELAMCQELLLSGSK